MNEDILKDPAHSPNVVAPMHSQHTLMEWVTASAVENQRK